MADRTTFYFAATAAGMRPDDVERAIELAEYLTNSAQELAFFAPRVWFSPKRLALRHNGTMIAKDESLYLASGHVFIADWNIVVRYRFGAGEHPVALWDHADKFVSKFEEFKYL